MMKFAKLKRALACVLAAAMLMTMLTACGGGGGGGGNNGGSNSSGTSSTVTPEPDPGKTDPSSGSSGTVTPDPNQGKTDPSSGSSSGSTSTSVKIFVNTENEAYGMATGSGIYKVGDTVTLKATVSYGGVFVGWKLEDKIISTDTTYTFTAFQPAGQNTITIVSVFAKDTNVAINQYNFPDEIFREYVSANFDKDSNGLLSVSEIAAVTYIKVSGNEDQNGNITSLKGIEYFTELRDLNYDWNKIYYLDLFQNTKLVTLQCYGNQLVSLEFTNNLKLKELYCGNNKIGLLDVSNLTELTVLWCNTNSLYDLDVSKNTKLEDLHCASNQLKTLDVSKNINLEYLNCTDNSLKELDVSKNSSLTDLVCDVNDLTALDVSQNSLLTCLDCECNALTSLTLNTALETLICYGNALTTLDISKCTNLELLNCLYMELSFVDIRNCPKLTDISVDAGVPVIRNVTITVNANNSSYGTVSGGGIYTAGVEITLTASPSEDSKFVCWQENGETVSTDATYTFTSEITDTARSFVAVFESTIPDGLKAYTNTSCNFKGHDYSNYYVLKNYTTNACYYMGNYSVLAQTGVTAVADAAAYTAQTGIVVDPTTDWNTEAGCIWKWRSVKQTTNTVQQQLGQIYTNIMNGKATIVRVKNSANAISVAAIGIKKSADKDNLSESDILLIDPSRGVVMNGSETTVLGIAAGMYDHSSDPTDYQLRVTP